jgi:hypothetical protein
MKTIEVGTIKSEAGKRVYGFLNILEHPIGTIERLPVIIAQGLKDGPTVWLTGNVHGDEYSGISVIHKLINSLDLEKFKGTIVAIPSLNPSGSRVIQRKPYYDKKDPNRLFPDANPKKRVSKKKEQFKNAIQLINNPEDKNLLPKNDDLIKITKDQSETEKEEKSNNSLTNQFVIYEDLSLYPSVQEIIWERIFKIVKKSADCLIDLHNAFIKSIPYVYLDRVLYSEDVDENECNKAKKLAKRTQKLVEAFGFTIVRETIPKNYVGKKLHRSTSGAALNCLRIPAFTVELGMYLEVDNRIVTSAVKGIKNVLRELKMLSGEKETIDLIPVIGQNMTMRHIAHPRVKKPAVIELVIEEGAEVKKGDVIAYQRDIFGRPLGVEGVIKTEVDGFVFMINQGIIRYPNEIICWIAVEDDLPIIAKWPKS